MADEEMTIDERRKYLRKLLPSYVAAERAGRGGQLDEMGHVTGMHRKSLVRLLAGQDLGRKQRRAPRGREYGLEVERAVAVVWESLDYVCAERLRPALAPVARHLVGFGESTLERMLGRLGRPAPRLPRKGPEEANRLRAGVRMGRMPWDTARPGHFEVDLVHHCGPSASGEYAHTLQLVDVATGWSERASGRACSGAAKPQWRGASGAWWGGRRSRSRSCTRTTALSSSPTTSYATSARR